MKVHSSPPPSNVASAPPAATNTARSVGPPQHGAHTAEEAQHDAAPDTGTPAEQITLTPVQESGLVQVRLGVAGSMYTALRSKHLATAQHSLRVALGCSAWAQMMGLPEKLRDEIELAALFHDVGKIGVPDEILCKPGALDPQEAAVMDNHWITGLQILQGCCADRGVLEIVAYGRAWYNGRKGSFDRAGDQVPIGGRMLAIVDAFDSMVTDQVYRRAMSLERAMDELFRFAGHQFDPDLVALFARLYESDYQKMQEGVAHRWLQSLDPETANSQWRCNRSMLSSSGNSAELLFQQKLLDNMYDGVVFIDKQCRVLLWNRGAERLTGIAGGSIQRQKWLPSVVKLRDEDGRLIRDDDCPIAYAIRTGVQWLRRLTIQAANGRPLAVDAHAVPVLSNDGVAHGLTLLLHDVSGEISLEERCQDLHELATKDPLTQVANRAEFDRALQRFVTNFGQSKRPCSLIMTDIDRFKKINDTFGHQAGDEVIQSLAKLLKNYCRPGDLVARYGGEEFVVLCSDCDNATAAQRGEEIRRAFGTLPHPGLGGECVTASFGVTEIQAGDQPDTMLNRADRALYKAKESGRNRVVQLGIGSGAGDEGDSAEPLRKRLAGNMLVEQDLLTESPLDRCIEKLRGFVADQGASIESADDQRVLLRFGGSPFFRRGSDRGIGVMMDLRLQEEVLEAAEHARGQRRRTLVHVVISAQRTRERRKADAVARARQLLISLRSYLMATDAGPGTVVDVDAHPGLLGKLLKLLS